MEKKSIQYWRRERGLSQYELSLASEIPRPRIQLHEQGLLLLTNDEIQVLCEVLGIEKDSCGFKETTHEK